MRTTLTVNHIPKIVKIGRGKNHNVWDDACALTLIRHNPTSSIYSGIPIDPGVTYFILQMERLGCETYYSCQGHPTGFYVSFISSDAIARQFVNAGFFYVQLTELPGRYRLGLDTVHTEKERIHTMRQAAQVWEQVFGPLDLGLANQVAIDKPFPRLSVMSRPNRKEVETCNKLCVDK